MANLIVFCILAVVILGSAIMSVLTKRIMRSATFLLFVLYILGCCANFYLRRWCDNGLYFCYPISF